MKLMVCVKQVPDTETRIRIAADGRSIDEAGVNWVVSPYDEYALEAALQLRDTAGEGEVTVLTVGPARVSSALRTCLAMGADTLILCQDAAFSNIPDSYQTALILRAAVDKLEPFDLIICGRQASDWDNAQVPLFLAELLDIPCLPLGQKVDVAASKVQVNQIVPDGVMISEASLPALVTVSNELGEARYPTLRGIMAASRKQPERLTLDELGLTADDLKPALSLRRLFIPESESQVEIIEGEDEADAGRKLALRLRELNLI